MSLDPHDTIAAVASPAGAAARGIVRLSGPDTVACVEKLFSSSNSVATDHATRISGKITLGDRGDSFTLPADLLLWPDERSYTRQPVAELHTVGSPPLIEAVLQAVCRAGARLAEPGEFTLRAFLAGRIDLTQAEAVIGVVDAQTEGQYQNALSQLAGGMSQPLNQLRENLLQLLAELEAGLDFVEEDIEFVSHEVLASKLASALETVESLRHQMADRTDANATARVVLWGPPNAGKSSLFNALVHRYGLARNEESSPAIVSHQSGTTRDYLIAEIELDGIACQLVDTAGITDTKSKSITADAQRHSTEQKSLATIRLICSDSEFPVTSAVGCRDIHVLTKADLIDDHQRPSQTLRTSSHTGQGLSALAVALRLALLAETTPADSSVVASTAARCQESLRLAAESLRRGKNLAEQQLGEELVAAETRTALNELGKVVGAVYTDDILDRVFSTFCIGK